MDQSRRDNDDRFRLLHRPTPDVSHYDDGTALTEYVWWHYKHLLTPAEARAGLYTIPCDRDAAIKAKGPQFADYLDRIHGPVEKSEVDLELRDGYAALYLRARDRILREHVDSVFINRCPSCRRIVRSPGARQCLWCKHDWHGNQNVSPGTLNSILKQAGLK